MLHEIEHVICPNCERRLRIDPSLAGRRVRCPSSQCRTAFIAPGQQTVNVESDHESGSGFLVGVLATIALCAVFALGGAAFAYRSQRMAEEAALAKSEAAKLADQQAQNDAAERDRSAKKAAILAENQRRSEESEQQKLRTQQAEAEKARLEQARAERERTARQLDIEVAENAAWNQAASIAAVHSYEQYLREYPSGKNAASARRMIAEQKPEQDAWTLAQSQFTIDSLRRYLKQFPNGKHARIARENLEDQVWAEAKQVNQIASFRSYVIEFPTGRYAQSARSEIQFLNQQQRADLITLAPATRGTGVPNAAPYQATAVHPIAILASGGKLHPWHDQVNPSWLAALVEEAQLVVSIDSPKSHFVSVHQFRDDLGNAAPSITRYRSELKVRVCMARTGKLLVEKNFVNYPREVGSHEPYNLTRIENPVYLSQVEDWLKQYVNP